MNCAIILAAGEGSRMKSKMPKVLHEVMGKPMLQHVIDQCKIAGVDKIIVIIGHGSEKLKSKISDESIIFREQPVGDEYPYGTGFAVMQGIDEIDDNDNVLIVCGDTPLIRNESLESLMNYHDENKNSGSILTAVVENSFGYGRIIREESGQIEKIVEQKDGNAEELKVKEINSGIFVFNGEALKQSLKEINSDNAQNELYITDVISVLKDKGKSIGGLVVEDNDEIFGVNSRVQLAQCNELMKKRINDHWLTEGVSMVSPDTVYIESDVKIGRDTILYPNVILQGGTEVGEECIIYGQTRIIASIIGDNTTVESSVIEESQIGNNTSVGPFAHLRPGNKVGNDVKIGNFVELKNSIFGNNSKAGHLAYIGDGEVGNNVNIGCGVIFANYDGKAKHKTIIKDNSFIGSNSNLVAPVTIEENAYVAAGSTITTDVKSGDLAIERAKQRSIENWVVKRGLNK